MNQILDKSMDMRASKFLVDAFRWALVCLFLTHFSMPLAFAQEEGKASKEPAEEVAEKTCKGNAEASGRISSNRGKIVFSSAPAEVRSVHCVDVDAADQAGCISAYSVKIGEERGCRASFNLVRSRSDNVFSITNLQFSVDSFCPGWRDKHEGTYILDSGDLSASAPFQVVKGEEAKDWTCFKADIDVQGTGEFDQGSGFGSSSIDVTALELNISGSVGSAGQVNAPCLTERKAIVLEKIEEDTMRRALPSEPFRLTTRWDLGGGVGLLTGSAIRGEKIAVPYMFYGRLSVGSSFVLVGEAGLGSSASRGEIGDETLELSHHGVGVGYLVGSDIFEWQPRVMFQRLRQTYTLEASSDGVPSEEEENIREAEEPPAVEDERASKTGDWVGGVAVGSSFRVYVNDYVGFVLDLSYMTKASGPLTDSGGLFQGTMGASFRF